MFKLLNCSILFDRKAVVFQRLVVTRCHLKLKSEKIKSIIFIKCQFFFPRKKNLAIEEISALIQSAISVTTNEQVNRVEERLDSYGMQLCFVKSLFDQIQDKI